MFCTPQDADSVSVQGADAIIIGTTENFGAMSGLIKDFFERIFRHYFVVYRAIAPGSSISTATPFRNHFSICSHRNIFRIIKTHMLKKMSKTCFPRFLSIRSHMHHCRYCNDGVTMVFMKDYFKTIQGKFVAPTPMENIFAENPHTEQICLLGRGYSKTVMTCVLSDLAQQLPRETIEAVLRERVDAVNAASEKHARIGAVVVSTEPWLIENGVLTNKRSSAQRANGRRMFQGPVDERMDADRL